MVNISISSAGQTDIQRKQTSCSIEWDDNLTLIEEKEIKLKKQTSKTSDNHSLSIYKPLRDLNLIKNKSKRCFNFVYY